MPSERLRYLETCGDNGRELPFLDDPCEIRGRFPNWSAYDPQKFSFVLGAGG
jgi:hypothetical protein